MDKEELFKRVSNNPDFIEQAGLSKNDIETGFGGQHENKYLKTLDIIIRNADQSTVNIIFNKIKNTFRI